jgi:hypothetical protein
VHDRSTSPAEPETTRDALIFGVIVVAGADDHSCISKVDVCLDFSIINIFPSCGETRTRFPHFFRGDRMGKRNDDTGSNAYRRVAGSGFVPPE